MGDSFLTKWERIIKATPLTGHIMEPEKDLASQAASIICGHDLVQRMSEHEQAQFELFVREVIRSVD